MNHTEFDWDFENITHMARHGISPAETEEVLSGLTVEVDLQVVDGEERFVEVGQTESGRMLEVASTEGRGRTRVITAYHPSRSALTAYHLVAGGAY